MDGLKRFLFTALDAATTRSAFAYNRITPLFQPSYKANRRTTDTNANCLTLRPPNRVTMNAIFKTLLIRNIEIILVFNVDIFCKISRG